MSIPSNTIYSLIVFNPKRIDPPDIDIDFPWDERDSVIDYVFKKYGDCAAMVANHNYLRGKSAARGRKSLWDSTRRDISYVLDRLPNIKLNAKWENILKLSTRIEGIVRHLSVHCGGIIITPKPVHYYVPVENSKKGVPVIQWEKDQTEDAGLVKIDLLGKSISCRYSRYDHGNQQRNQYQVENSLSPPTAFRIKRLKKKITYNMKH